MAKRACHVCSTTQVGLIQVLGADQMTTRLEVYEAAGRALEISQLFETELGTALLALDALETGSHLNPVADAYVRLRSEVDGITLGKTLRRIAKRLELPEDTEIVFSRALEARNFVAHHLFKRNNVAILDAAGCALLFSEAEQAISTIRPAYSAAQVLAARLVTQVLSAAKLART
jgi:hypothetical protein